MNRIQLVDPQYDESHATPTRFSGDYNYPQTQRVPAHRFFIPLHYEKNYAYPLLIWMHGPGGGEAEINQVMPHVSLRNYVGVSLRGPCRDVPVTECGEATFTWRQSLDGIQYAMEDVLGCIAVARRRFNVAANRVFLVGNDVGGTMALRLGLAMPDRFAGVVSIGGALPDDHAPLAGIHRARTLPVMLVHCRDSEVYSSDDVCNDLRLLHSAGIAVTLRQYPCPQEVTTQMLSDINVWMMEQVAGEAAISNATACVPSYLRTRDLN